MHLSIGAALREQLPDISRSHVYELSASGPFVEYLRRSAHSLYTSEYFEDAPPGSLRDSVRCEDIQRLTYADASFDVVTHTEVMEHVPDDARAFAELRRVLRPGGIMVFTVPFFGGEHTVERARLCGDHIEYLCEPVYHTDPLHDGTGILAYRDYGLDIVQRLREAGFDDVRITSPQLDIRWLKPRDVVLARVLQ